MGTFSACRIVAGGGVGESGSSKLLMHKATGAVERLVVLRKKDSTLCANTGAVGLLLVNGVLVAQGVIGGDTWSIQSLVNPGDQVVAVVHLFPLFNMISCVSLGELNVALEECDLVTKEEAARVISIKTIESRNWFAWINQQPPPPDEFLIVGDIDVPNPGIGVQLIERPSQGINPDVLLMDLVLVQQPGQWPQQVTTKQVRYDKVLVNTKYESVEVYYNQELLVKIPVLIVS
jgi:hypothetical protein